ncbi:hypothetical protein Taro_025892 [Colocasia esculenta]|uniref:Uncharacterized protein n=1 Tax=Colocasia esculenta TaxID=4460 RepID=A0A843VDJ7_COLES|nr:hypothetical protein [Colocasia esculenta]
MSAQKPGAAGVPSDRKAPFDELRWVIRIRHTLDEDLEEEDGVAVSVFNVPKTLLASKSEAYTPQLIALGPYHHWRPELYDMERYKLSAAKRTQRHLPNSKFQHLVDGFAKHEHRIRAHYHRHTLAWMMAVDAAFLLEFLQIHAIDEGGKVLHRLSSRMSHLVDHAGRKSAHNTILRDAVMLENQVPLFLLRKLLELRFSSSELGDDALGKMVTGFLKELCPFKLMENFPCIDVAHHAHLLEALYYVLVPKSEEDKGDNNDEIEEQNEGDDGGRPGEQWKSDSTHVRQLLAAVWSFASGANRGPVCYIKHILVSRPITFVVKAPWRILTSLPGFSILKQPVEYLFSQANKKKEDGDGDPAGSSRNADKPPLIEEIMIPSVAELVSAGVRFRPTSGDVTSVDFDPKTATF